MAAAGRCEGRERVAVPRPAAGGIAPGGLRAPVLEPVLELALLLAVHDEEQVGVHGVLLHGRGGGSRHRLGRRGGGGRVLAARGPGVVVHGSILARAKPHERLTWGWITRPRRRRPRCDEVRKGPGSRFPGDGVPDPHRPQPVALPGAASARTVSIVSASAAALSSRYRRTRANRSASPPG